MDAKVKTSLLFAHLLSANNKLKHQTELSGRCITRENQMIVVNGSIIRYKLLNQDGKLSQCFYFFLF